MHMVVPCFVLLWLSYKVLVNSYNMFTHIFRVRSLALVQSYPRGGTPSLRVSRYAPRFCPPFSASGRSFCPPKFDHVYHFIQILLGLISKAPLFQYVDDLIAPQIGKIYRFIQNLLGPILNFERRTPPPDHIPDSKVHGAHLGPVGPMWAPWTLLSGPGGGGGVGGALRVKISRGAQLEVQNGTQQDLNEIIDLGYQGWLLYAEPVKWPWKIWEYHDSMA